MSDHEHQWGRVRTHHRYTIHRCPCGTTTKTMKEKP